MSYDIRLNDPVSGETIQFDASQLTQMGDRPKVTHADDCEMNEAASFGTMGNVCTCGAGDKLEKWRALNAIRMLREQLAEAKRHSNMLRALLDRDITFSGRHAMLTFESHYQAINHICEARAALAKVQS